MGGMHGRGCVCMADGVCVTEGGGMCDMGKHGRGTCMVGGHAWQGACMAGGMHGIWGHAWQGVCMAGGICNRGCAWQGGCMAEGMHGRGCAWWGWGATCMAGGHTCWGHV